MEYRESRQVENAGYNGSSVLVGGIIVSEEEWGNLDDFTLTKGDLSNSFASFSNIQEGHIVGYKHVNTNEVDSLKYVTNLAYRISNVNREAKTVTVTSVDSEEEITVGSSGKNSVLHFTFVRDHVIACKLNKPEITFSKEL